MIYHVYLFHTNITNFIIHYTIFFFANPVLTYRCYANGLNIEPSNTNKYITGTLNKGQPLNRGKGRKGDGLRGGKGEVLSGGERLRSKRVKGKSYGVGKW